MHRIRFLLGLFASAVCTLLLFPAMDSFADDYPPYYSGTGSPNPVHFAPVSWPDDSSWIPYTMRGSDQKDQRISDPSNGGTSPQNYVNVSSGDPDQDAASIYYAYDAANQVVFFRWRVQSIPNTYATGPSPGAYATTDPWRSALWTVLIDLDGDGYREFAVQLDGSSGGPGEEVDRLTSYYSDTPNQYIEPSYAVAHNPAAFVDDTATTILSFQNSLTPTTSWPNGSDETLWDYGTTRSTYVHVGGGIYEYLVDYQIPLGMMDASALGGPTVDSSTPMSFSFTTSNSLTNPLQKDVVFMGDFTADPASPVPTGDTITLDGDVIQQPIIREIAPAGCGPVTLTATVTDSLDVTSGTPESTVTAVDFYYYYDENANGSADDGNSWTLAVAATEGSQIGQWSASWDTSTLPQGAYLIGAQAVDDGTLNLDGVTSNRTFSYLATGDLPADAVNEDNWANPSSTGIVTGSFINTCGTPPPYVAKSVNPDTQAAGGNVQFTVAIVNTDTLSSLDVNTITDTLPTGFTYVSTDGGTLTPTVSPVVGASGAISWTFAPDTIAASGTGTLIFTASVSATPGTYSNVVAVDTSEGTLTSDPVQIFVGDPELTIAKSANVTSAGEGDTITYTITYSNNSPVSVTNVVLTDPVPDGATFISASNGGIHDGGSPGTVTWNLPNLPAGDGPYSVTMTVTVDNPYPDAAPIPMVNTATIDSDESAASNASASVFITAPRPNLVIQKDGDVLVSPGDTGVVYTLSYENVGNATATGVTVQDVIPSGFTLNVAGTTAGYTESPAGTFTWSVADVAVSGTGSITVALDVDNPFSATNPATNTATIDSNETNAVSDTFRIGVGTGVACSTYYFHSSTINAGTGAASVYEADTTAPTATTDSTVTVSTQTTYSSEAASDVELIRFYEDPVTASSVTIAGSPTATIWVSESGAQGAHSRLYLYDYEPSGGTETLLGTSGDQTFSGTSPQAVAYTVTLSPSNPTLASGHRLLWVLMIWDLHNTQQEDVTIYFDSVDDGAGVSPDHTSQSEVCYTAPAELVIDKQVDKLSVTPTPNPPGLQTLQYTIEFTNIGGTDATGCTIEDTLPTGVTFVSATLNGTSTAPDVSASPTYTWNVESSAQAVDSNIVGAGESGTLVINVTVDAPLDPSILSLQNSATFDDDNGTVAAVNDTATTTVLLPDLSVQKSVSDSLLIPGDTFTYTLIVTNNGQATANNLVVTDTLPVATGDINYLSNDVSATWASPTLTWDITSLAAGASVTANISMSVDSAPLTFSGIDTQDNTASVVSDETTSVNSNTVTVTISTNPNLSITKSVSPAVGPYAPGDELTYTLLVENIGSADAEDVQVLDSIPTYTAYSASSITLDTVSMTDIDDGDAARFDAVNNRIAVALGTMTAGASNTITFDVVVDSVMAHGDTDVTNTSTVSAGNTATKTDSVTTTVTAAANITLTKTGPSDIAYPVTTLNGDVAASTTLVVNDTSQLAVGDVIRVAGQDRTITAISGTDITVDSAVTASDGDAVYGSITYSLIYQNTGNADATSVSLSDTLPAGVDYFSASTTPNSGPNPLVWSTNEFGASQTLAAGGSGTIMVTVIPTSTGVKTNSATITSVELGAVNATLDTGVGGLVVTKSTSTPSVTNTPAGAQATYTIVIENTLASATPADIEVTDYLFSGFSYASTTSTTFTTGSGVAPSGFPTVGDIEATWSGITINGSSTLEITFVADVDPAVGEAVYDNEVDVSSPSTPDLTIIQFDETLTTAEDVTVSIEYADLSLTKAASNETPTVGSTVTFTLTLTNDGPDTATNVTVQDQLPNGYSYTAATISGGDSQNVTGGPVSALLEWTVNSLASGASVTLTYDAVVQSYVSGTTVYLNSAEVTDADQYDPDSTPADGEGDDFALVNASPAGQADLSVTKIPSAGPWVVGNTVTFTITVTNDAASTSDATNIVVRDILPDGYSYSAVTIGGDAGSVGDDSGVPTLTWTIASLGIGNSIDLTYDAVVQAQDPGVTYINAAEVTAVDQNDPDSTPKDGVGDDYAEVNATPSGSADLSLSKSPSSANPNVGDTVTFTITVANDAGSTDTATNIRVEDTVPNGYAYTVGTMAGGSSQNEAGDPVLIWTISSLAPGATTDLTYDAVVQAPGVGVSHTNTVEITQVDQYDPDSTPDDGTGDDYADATASPSGIGTVAGTIYVDNNDNGVYDAGVDDPLPFVDVVITDSGGTPHTVTTDENGEYSLSVLAGSTTVDVDDADLPTGASLTTGDTDPASVTVNDSATTTADTGYVLPGGSGLLQGYLYNDVNGNGLYDAGDTLLPNIDVVITKSDASTVTVSTDANGYYQTVAPTGTTIVDVDETDPDYPAGITLTTNASGQGNDSQTVTVADTQSVTVYTGYVTPAGTGTVDGVVYEDVNGDGSYDGGDTLLSGVGVTITDVNGGVYTVTTDASGAFSVVVAAGNATVDVDETTLPASYVLTPGAGGDGDDPTTVLVPSGGSITDDTGYVDSGTADLSLTKTPQDTNLSAGDTVTFEITVANSGTSLDAATNITVQDVLPNGYTYVGGSMTGGSSQDEGAAPTLEWTINTLGIGASVTLTFQAVLVAEGPGVDHVNQAEVTASDQYDPDSTPDDGTGDDYDTYEWSFSTPVRQLTGSAVAGASGGIDVFWSTVGEDGIVKFEVQRRADDGYKPIGEVFAKAAFLGSADYAFTDRGVAVDRTYSYRIAVVNIGGGGEKYDVGVATCVSAAAPLPSVKSSAAVFAATRSGTPDASVERLTYDVPQFVTGLPKQWGQGAKAEIRQTGVYQVPPVGNVYNLGCELPKLDADKVFVRGLRNFYTDSNALWCGTMSSSGTPQSIPEPVPDGVWNSSGFTGVFRAEVDADFDPNTYLPPGPNWYFPADYDLNGGTLRTVSMTVVSPRSGTATVSVAVRSDTSGSHNMTIGINGTQVGTAEWEGTGHYLVSAGFSAELLVDGSNSIQLATGGTGSSKKLDYVELVTPAEPKLRDVGLLVRVESGASSTMTVPEATFAVDATTFAAERQLTITDGAVSDLSAGDLVYFCNVFGAPSWDGERTLSVPPFADVDYLAVASEEMLAELDPLLAHHTKSGLKTASVSMETMTDVYGCGIFGPGSIVSLSEEVSPDYLLLAGTTTYDYLDHENLHTPVGIPVGFIHVREGLAATDDIYSNGFATAVGRFPARSSEELSSMVAKTISFRPASGAVLLAGWDWGVGASDRFKALQSLLTDIMPSTLIASSEGANETLQNRLIHAINEGARLVTYQGHAGYQQLDYDALIGCGDVTRIPPSAWLLSTCYAGTYIVNDWSLPLLVHRLLREPERGAVSVICSTRMGDMMEEHAIVREALTLIADEKPTWGAVLQYLKKEWGHLRTVDHYTLLGDPALPTLGGSPDDRELTLLEPLGGEIFATAPVPVRFLATGEGWWRDTIEVHYRSDGDDWSLLGSLELVPEQKEYEIDWQPTDDGALYQIKIGEAEPLEILPVQSASGWFTVDRTPPGIPVALSPGDGEDVCSPAALLSVSAVDETSGVVAYLFEVDDIESGWQSGSVFALTDLDDGQHSWRARSQDAGGLMSDWSNLFTFFYCDGGDDDGDSLLDSWEMEHFGRLSFSDGTGDSDGDGVSDLDEFHAGTPPFEFTIAITESWNLLAFPCVPDAESAAALEAAFITPFWAWQNGVYVDPVTSEPYQGFWAFAPEACTLKVTGAVPEKSTVVLTPGWNLAGPGRPLASPSGPPLQPVWRWMDAVYQVLPTRGDGAQFAPLTGYWIYNDSDDNIILPMAPNTE